MKFCCACNGAIKNLKSQEKKSTFFHFFFNKILICPKITDFLKTSHIFSDSRVFSRNFDNLFICLDLIIKL